MMHKIGDRISRYRKDRNLSQEEMASTLNVSRQTVSKWETGDTLPDVYNAVALANLFHVSLDTLILGGGAKYSESSYIGTLKEKRHKINLRAIIVGGFGSLCFASSLILLDALGAPDRIIGIVMVCIFPILMTCWGYAIWNFIKIARIGEEIKYLQQKELLSLTNNHSDNPN